MQPPVIQPPTRKGGGRTTHTSGLAPVPITHAHPCMVGWPSQIGTGAGPVWCVYWIRVRRVVPSV